MSLSQNNFPSLHSAVEVKNTVDVNVTNATINATISDISGSVQVTNFPSSQDINIASINTDFIESGGFKTYLLNTDIAVTNSVLSSLSIQDDALKVSDLTTHDTLTNIYNCVNTRGSGIFVQGAISADSITSVVDLSTVAVKTLTIYGVSSDPTTLTVMFGYSNSNLFKSQYSVVIDSAGNFGFSINCCPKYICIHSSLAVDTLQVYLDYS